ncbi:importin-5-like [Lytechinus variegatus]|uniref:importin-5-like n=1 Tax=Lytechinus variegatus TaxID=7654 RepID=UPI001BB23F2B|nr:importin-5-like [Lytechinus variegatus]
MAGPEEQFSAVLANLMSPDNDIRSHAEQAYEGIAPAIKVQFLIQTIGNQGPPERTQLAAVLLRRVFNTNFDQLWPNTPQDVQEMIKTQLVQILQHITDGSLRRKVCDAIAELARNLIDDDGNQLWPDILQFLFQCSTSNSPELKESALHIFNNFPGIFGNKQEYYLVVIKGMLAQCLEKQEQPQVRVVAAKATISFIVTNGKEKAIQKHFMDLMPGVLDIVTESIKGQEDDTLLKAFLELEESTPKLLRPYMDSILNLAVSIIQESNFPDSWRQLGLEMVVTLSEAAAATLRRYPKHIESCVPLMLNMMMDLEDDPDWANSDEIDDEDNDSNAVAGESALDRFACGIGGKTILPHIINAIPKMLQQADWKSRHAALMAVSAVGEGCHKEMEALLQSVLDSVLPYLLDEHPRVRYAACNALGQMATDFAPTFELKFHEKVIGGLLRALDDYGHPRVQAHAGAALVNFSEDCPKSILQPYLQPILEKLEAIIAVKMQELLQKGTKLVLEQMVTTLAAVADTTEENFTPFYDKFMPSLKYIIQNANTKEYRLLRGKTIECVSLIGLAVGTQKFMQDANEVMDLLLRTQTDSSELEDDDPQTSYMISAWARMCKLLGPSFANYLPVVMKPLLKTASLKPEVALLDSEAAKNISEEEGWQFVNLGDQQSFGIKTAGLEDKSTACQMLVCYARELKEAFSDYTDQVVEIMVPLLKFYFHDVVRYTASESLPLLLECAKIKGEDYLDAKWAYIYPELLKAIQTEPEVDILQQHMESFSKCIEFLGQRSLNLNQMQEVGTTLNDMFEQHFKRQQERQEQRKDEDYDDIVEEGLQDEDDDDVYLLSKISDILHAVLGTYADVALPFFEMLMKNIIRLLPQDKPWTDRQWGICMFDDLIEFCGSIAWQYKDYFLASMQENLQDKSPEVRQAASYGFGVMAKCGGEQFAQACVEAVPFLSSTIMAAGAREKENLNATENSIAAVTKIIKYHQGRLNLNELIPLWFSWLPVTEDKEEAGHVYDFLCDIAWTGNEVIMGKNNQNLPNILSVIAEAFDREALSENEEVFRKCCRFIRDVQNNGDIWGPAFAELNEEHQRVITAALQMTAS